MPTATQYLAGIGIATVIVLSSIPLVIYEADRLLDDPTYCTLQHKGDRSGCLDDKAHDCVWCVAKAVPSACYNSEIAKGLPHSVFKCEGPVSIPSDSELDVESE